jgi:radical SAM superfamily enzyme YgiQ (UPF0313 family)
VRVLLISANTERINMASLPLGLSLVAAAVREAGHPIAFLDLLTQSDPRAAIRLAIERFSPEVIGISVRNIDDQHIETQQFLLEPVKDLIAECRTLTSVPIVLGGAGYSIYPQAALDYLGADFGVCGEGERALPLLLERLEQKAAVVGLPGVYLPHRGCLEPWRLEPDLDRLPLPSEELYGSANPSDATLWVPVQTRRGCPLDCAYCSTARIEGRPLRARSPERVVQYLAETAQRGFRRFHLVDNTFNLPPSYALAFCRAIAAARLDIAWRSILYPHNVSEELVAAMADAGCEEVSLGFESGSLPVLKWMNKRFEPEEVRTISDRLAACGIRRIGFLLLGGPAETRETVDESLAFARSLHLDALNLTIGIRIYPHTQLARTARDQGLIRPDDDLLRPRFYLRPELEAYIRQRVAESP